MLAAEKITMKKLIILVIAAGLTMLGGCVYHAPAPGTYSTTSSVSKFDRSWSAAIYAFSDQSVRITSQDRGAGVIQGTRNGINVTGSVQQQADGRVRVQFDTSGATTQDPGLIERITQSYNRRMGR